MQVPLLLLLIACLGGVFTDSALAASKKAAAPKAAPKTAGTKAKAAVAGPKPVATKARPRKTVTRARRRGRRVRVRFVPRQAAPTKDRYLEIQQALSTQGYFTGETDGQWDTESIDALKKFQQDQSLRPTGRIDSLSLIALGLGPKHNPISAIPVVQAGPAAAADDDDEELEVPATPAAQQQ